MTILRAMVVLPRETGLPADSTTNTFHFNTGGVLLPTDATDVANRLNAFYNTAGPVQAVGKYLCHEIVGSASRLKVYDLSDPEPRAPIYDELFTITETAGGDCMPSEIAVCFSYHTAFPSGAVKARHRGRVFIGPVNVQAQSFISGEVYVSPDIIGDLKAAGVRLVAADTALLKWSVYSPTDGTAHAPVIGGWIDNAFDVQRRRGVSATTRNIWP